MPVPNWTDRTVRGPDAEFLTPDEFRGLFGLDRDDFEELLKEGIALPPLKLSARKTVFTWEHAVHLDIWFRRGGCREYTGMFGKCQTPNADRVQQIYFIRSGERVKIGTAHNVEARLAALQTSCPDDLELLHATPGGFREEGALHKRFASDRIRPGGEWFHYSAEIGEYVDRLKAGGSPPE